VRHMTLGSVGISVGLWLSKLRSKFHKFQSERKYALLFAATILAARKLANLSDNIGPTPAKICAVETAIDQAKFILDRIEARWPEGPQS